MACSSQTISVTTCGVGYPSDLPFAFTSRRFHPVIEITALGYQPLLSPQSFALQLRL
jgi:hypothetical protein